MRFEIYQDKSKDREWRWRLLAGNNKDIIADSGEGYANRTDCLRVLA